MKIHNYVRKMKFDVTKWEKSNIRGISFVVKCIPSKTAKFFGKKETEITVIDTGYTYEKTRRPEFITNKGEIIYNYSKLYDYVYCMNEVYKRM